MFKKHVEFYDNNCTSATSVYNPKIFSEALTLVNKENVSLEEMRSNPLLMDEKVYFKIEDFFIRNGMPITEDMIRRRPELLITYNLSIADYPIFHSENFFKEFLSKFPNENNGVINPMLTPALLKSCTPKLLLLILENNAYHEENFRHCIENADPVVLKETLMMPSYIRSTLHTIFREPPKILKTFIKDIDFFEKICNSFDYIKRFKLYKIEYFEALHDKSDIWTNLLNNQLPIACLRFLYDERHRFISELIKCDYTWTSMSEAKKRGKMITNTKDGILLNVQDLTPEWMMLCYLSKKKNIYTAIARDYVQQSKRKNGEMAMADFDKIHQELHTHLSKVLQMDVDNWLLIQKNIFGDIKTQNDRKLVLKNFKEAIASPSKEDFELFLS